jgi:hypothetical protein
MAISTAYTMTAKYGNENETDSVAILDHEPNDGFPECDDTKASVEVPSLALDFG